MCVCEAGDGGYGRELLPWGWVNIILLSGNLCWCVDREVGKMARGGDSEELGIRTKTILHVYFTL